MDLPSEEKLRALCSAMPLFPLPSVVLFPNTLLRLHIFEPRYVQLLQDCMAGERIMAIPQLKPGWDDPQTEPPMHRVAGVGFVIHCKKLPKDRYDIVLLGVGRIRIHSEQESDRLYRIGEAELLEDVVPLKEKWKQKSQNIKMLLVQLIMHNPELSEVLKPLMEMDDSILQFVNTLAHLLNRDPVQRQQFIEENDFLNKLQLLEESLTSLLLGGQIIQE